MAVEYVRYHASKGEEHLTAQLVECYRDVFADGPWDEWLKCQNDECGMYWGVKNAPLLAESGYTHCGEPLVDYWSRTQVVADITNEINQDKSSCWLAMEEGRIVGFCWGYPTDGVAFNNKTNLEADYSILGIEDPANTALALQDEVGVLVSYRGQKIAKKLVSLRNKDFRLQGLEYGVVRTREFPTPSITYLWYIKLGYQILARYPGDDGRVVMGIRLSHLA